MTESIAELLDLLRQNDGINDKTRLTKIISERFKLVQDRSVYSCKEFALRFSASGNQNFSNTVLSLSNLQKVDDRPFLVCLVTPTKNYLLLANTTFLKRISHSSHELRVNNIRGSFNGSDIMREFEGIPNNNANIDRLFNIHAGIGFDGNLARLVEATNDISPTGKKFLPSVEQKTQIMLSPVRASVFIKSPDANTLKLELDSKVQEFKNEILLAALIENVNVRGRIIEYLIAGEDERLRDSIVAALKAGTKGIPPFKTENDLGDYSREFDYYRTETDVKTKIMVLDSNPKAYNLDKMLEFLALERSVFMFYFVGVDPTQIANTVLVSIFQESLLRSTILLKHWAGRNSRGVSQFEGRTIGRLIMQPETQIDLVAAKKFLQEIIDL
jgi:hypothetical protein